MKKLLMLTLPLAIALAGCGKEEEGPAPSSTPNDASPPKFGTGDSAQPQGGPATPNTEFK